MPGAGGWGNGGSGSYRAPTPVAIDAPFGHGLTAAFGTRCVDPSRNGANPVGSAGPFQSSTAIDGGTGYLTTVTFIPLLT